MIRQANYDTDGLEIYNLVNDAYKIEIGNKGLAFKTTNRWHADVTDANIREQIGESLVYVSPDGKILGCVRSIVTNGVVLIGPIAVHVDFQEQGIGSKLLLVAEKLGTKAQVHIASCRTDVMDFYKHRGYVEMGKLPRTGIPDWETHTRKDIYEILAEKTVAQE